MFYDISFLWGWLLASLILGIAVGWMTEKAGPQGPWFFGWFRWALIAFVVGLVVAWLYWLPGRLGLWLEMALLEFAGYIIGCLLGGFLKTLFATEPATVAAASPTPFVAATSPAGALAAAPAPAPASVAPGPIAAEPARVVPVAPVAAVPASAPTPEEPAPIGPIEGEDKHGGQRPAGLVSPRGGQPDDLKRIKGIGPQNEGRLHALGVWHFAQIAAWTPENVHWVGSYLSFPGRIDREQWIEQASTLARGGETEFSQRVERGEVAKSHDGGTHGQDNIADLSKIKPQG